ncbi:MAG: kynureninase [Planctomycetes bacterium]|nr:kynureninase [Planctomycetota bacterium]
MHVDRDSGSCEYSVDRSCALRLDEADGLAFLRERFCFPKAADGSQVIYFAGNSLGLQPKAAQRIVTEELEDWANLAVDAHFSARRPWYNYHEQFRASAARLVGASPHEVVLMNSLTTNLHLMMVSFYRPTTSRYKILTDWPSFPSDIYAVESQIRHHGFDPNDAFIKVKPREGDHLLETADIETLIEEHGSQIALVLIAGVNYYTGQFYDIESIANCARKNGCAVGVDLAHAAGNVPLHLHDWNVDFAAWCNYKYLNGGPGTVGGCFVHERHARDVNLPRFAGWWGNDPQQRFKMHMVPEFSAVPSADGWQLSNPPILAMAAIRAAYDVFDETSMQALRTKSKRLTGYLEYLIDTQGDGRFEIITPRDPEQRGSQLSILAKDDPRALFQSLQDAHAVGDFREPNVIRVAPVPSYNTFDDVWRFVQILTRSGG